MAHIPVGLAEARKKIPGVLGPVRRQGMSDLRVEGTFHIFSGAPVEGFAGHHLGAGCRGFGAGAALVQVPIELGSGREFGSGVGRISIDGVYKAHCGMDAAGTRQSPIGAEVGMVFEVVPGGIDRDGSHGVSASEANKRPWPLIASVIPSVWNATKKLACE